MTRACSEHIPLHSVQGFGSLAQGKLREAITIPKRVRDCLLRLRSAPQTPLLAMTGLVLFFFMDFRGAVKHRTRVLHGRVSSSVAGRLHLHRTTPQSASPFASLRVFELWGQLRNAVQVLQLNTKSTGVNAFPQIVNRFCRRAAPSPQSHGVAADHGHPLPPLEILTIRCWRAPL